MIFSIMARIVLAFLAGHAHHTAPVPAPVAIVHTVTVAAPAPVSESPCSEALAYLHAHANPAFSMTCSPGAFGNGIVDETYLARGGGGAITIGDPGCFVGVENEASNSWLQQSSITYGSGALNDHRRHDASGRIVDPFGECG